MGSASHPWVGRHYRGPQLPPSTVVAASRDRAGGSGRGGEDGDLNLRGYLDLDLKLPSFGNGEGRVRLRGPRGREARSSAAVSQSHTCSSATTSTFARLLCSPLLTVQNRAQAHRKPTGDLVPFSPRRVLLDLSIQGSEANH
jgi:hypothetical protein